MNVIDSNFSGVLLMLAQIAIKATVLLGFAGLLTVVLRRKSAALRHMIWTVALGSSVSLVFLTALLPAWKVIPMPVQSEVSAPAIKSAIPQSKDSSVRPASATVSHKNAVERVKSAQPSEAIVPISQ